jgi:hypothetical protein
MLAKILKGSKDKKLLEHGLDKCPSYGYYSAWKEIDYKKVQAEIQKVINRLNDAVRIDIPTL